jgi:hypothetical protein
MKTITHAALCLCCGLCLSGLGQSVQTVPHLINYQGLLVDSTGNPLPDGNYTLTFNIYSNSTPSPGSLVWGPQIFDGQNGKGHGSTVALLGGRFNLILGPIDTNLNDIVSALGGTNRYLGIIVSGTTNIVPLQQILSAPFALKAGSTDTADNLSTNGYVAIFGNGNVGGAFIPGNKIQPASITASQIATGAVGSAQIAMGAVTNAQIAAGAVSADKLQLPLSLQGTNVLWLLTVTNPQFHRPVNVVVTRKARGHQQQLFDGLVAQIDASPFAASLGQDLFPVGELAVDLFGNVGPAPGFELNPTRFCFLRWLPVLGGLFLLARLHAH